MKPLTVLLEKLLSTDESVRLNAALDLAERGETIAIPTLIESLGHPNDTVRFFFAGNALQGFGQTAVPALLEALQQNGRIRSGAARVLYEMDVTNLNLALPIALKALTDADETACMDAAQLLSQIGEPAYEAVPGLIRLLHRDLGKQTTTRWQRDARWHAALTLAVIGKPHEEIVQALVQAIDSLEEGVAWAAIAGLSILQPSAKTAVPSLLRMLQDTARQTSLRLAAMRALAVVGDPDLETLPTLLAAAQDKDWVVRLTAVRFLGECGNPNPEQISIRHGAGTPVFDRLMARRWGRIQQVAVIVETLRQALHDENLDVRRNAVYGLSQLGELAETAVPDLLPLLQDPALCGAAAETLSYLGEKAVEAITAVMQTKTQAPTDLTYAAYTLSRMSHPLAQQTLTATGIQPEPLTDAHFCLAELPLDLDAPKQQAFDELWQKTVMQGEEWVDYNLPYPKHQFLTYLAKVKGLMMHGSNNPHIEVLKPIRNSTDSMKHGNVSGIYGEPDGIRPIFFAVVDRSQITGTTNTAHTAVMPDGTESRWYFLSVDVDAWLRAPWLTGTVYILPSETFVLDREWTSREPVRPLAKLAVTRADLPYPVWGVENQRPHLFVRDTGPHPFLDDIQIFPIKASNP